MTVRTYRVELIGQFDRPLGELRERLLAEQPEHDYTRSAFVPEGTFTYSATLTRFTLRYLIEVDAASAAEADAEADFEGELRATAYLAERGIAARALTTSSTCLDDVKLRRR